MGDFLKNFQYFEEFTFTWFERQLIKEIYPVIKQTIEDFTRKTREWPKYHGTQTDPKTILNLKQKIDKIVKLLDSSDKKREQFVKNFQEWEKQREKNIKKLREIAEKMQDVRKGSNIVKIAAGSIGVAGGAAIIGSLLFPPAAPALLPGWLGGAAASALLPSIFLPAAPAVSSLAIAGGVAAAGGAAGNVGASIAELVLNRQSLEEIKEIIAKDRKLLEKLGVFEFLDELNTAIENLFGKSTSTKILNDISEFLKEVPPVLNRAQPILKALLFCLNRILPGIKNFLLVGISLASVILSIFFVVFLVRRRGCVILKHRIALGLVSAIDAGVEITRLVAAAGLDGSKLAELIPRQLVGKIAVGAIAGVGIALDIATIVVSSIDLAEGSLSDEISMISEIAKKLEEHLKNYQDVYKKLQDCGVKRLKKNDVIDWTAIVVNKIPRLAVTNDITAALNQYLGEEAWDCIILEKLPTNGNHWLVKVPTSHAQSLLHLSSINIRGEPCLVMH